MAVSTRGAQSSRSAGHGSTGGRLLVGVRMATVRCRMAIEPRDARLPVAPDQAAPAAGIQDGDVERFLEDSLDRVYAFVARRIEDRSVVEELTTVAFERSLEVAMDGSRDLSSLGAFTLRVAASAVVDHARRTRRAIPPGVRARDLDADGDQVAAEALSDDAAVRAFAVAIDGDRLRRAVIGLAETHQRVILLVYFDGLGANEVATALGCPDDEVTIRLHRALRALRDATRTASNDVA